MGYQMYHMKPFLFGTKRMLNWVGNVVLRQTAVLKTTFLEYFTDDKEPKI